MEDNLVRNTFEIEVCGDQLLCPMSNVVLYYEETVGRLFVCFDFLELLQYAET